MLVSCLSTLLLACNRTASDHQAEQDARDVAWVEAAQKVHPPVQPLDPQPVDRDIRGIYSMAASGCEFLPRRRRGDAPIFVAGPVKAVLRVGDQPVVFAADIGSPELAAGVRQKYTARALWAELSAVPGALTLHDRWDRVVYAAAGTLTCHD